MTCAAGAESGPVMAVAVTTGFESQVVVDVPILESFRSSPRTMMQALSTWVAVAALLEVYRMAEWAAACKEISEYP